ncbi:FbpB family small basic protein [Bacillus piscicola]|uniref:FbpB family small basic protein n=1 Tax=Bacillus piscicola TaxID=1632684 RepID=UPI001F096DA7|nr:FbpB family small basic protein [Bacillus piscicola]
MRRTKRSTLEELIAANKQELMSDPSAISEIEKKLEERKAKEVYIKNLENNKKIVNK